MKPFKCKSTAFSPVEKAETTRWEEGNVAELDRGGAAKARGFGYETLGSLLLLRQAPTRKLGIFFRGTRYSFSFCFGLFGRLFIFMFALILFLETGAGTNSGLAI